MACQDFNIYMLKKNHQNKKNSNIASSCNNMGNARKTVIHIPKLNGWSIFVFIQYPLLFQNLTDLQ